MPPSQTSAIFPKIASLQAANIPSLLQAIPRWIVWRAGPLKATGKFDKIPTHPVKGYSIDPHVPANWLSFQDALHAHNLGVGNGVGIVLHAAHPVAHNGENYYLVALDFDDCVARANDLKKVRLNLGNPYVEISPSGKGLRMFGLSTQLLKGGNSGNGVEVYFDRQFLTVTGRQGRGDVKDVTTALAPLYQQWFAESAKSSTPTQSLSSPPLPPGLAPNISQGPPPETPDEVERVMGALAVLSSDIDYAKWRSLVWAILSTGWSCAEDIARDWSKLAADRYDDVAFGALVQSFNPGGGIALGTLFYHAEQNGWAKPKSPPLTTTTRLLTAIEVKALPNQPYRVRGLLPAEGVAAIYGESASGKSFLALDLCFSIAAGEPSWFGMTVKQAPVAYLALEGRGGVSKRIQAWELHNHQPVAASVRFMVKDFSILETEGVTELASDIVKTLGHGAVAVIDTLNQSAPGADENASNDMSRILMNAKLLAGGTKGLVVFVHHAGKDKGRGMRGHSSLFAAMDAVIEVTSQAGMRAWKVAKSKDDEAGAGFDFELVTVKVGVDQDGLEITSCAVGRTLNIAKPQSKPRPIAGKHRVAAMHVLRGVLAAQPAGVSETDAIVAVAAALHLPNGRKAAVARTTVRGLVAAGHLTLDGKGVIQLK